TDETKRKEAIAWALKSESKRLIDNMVNLAQSEPEVAVNAESWDQNKWLLNVQNGTLDLRTGQLRKHDRADLSTLIAPTSYDPAAGCPIWVKALDRIFERCTNTDAEPSPNTIIINFIQRLFGLFLTAEIEQILPIFYGCGANGKSTILGAIMG